FTGWPLHSSLMPVFARDVLVRDSAGLGMLMAAFGIGSLIGSTGLASVRDLQHAGKLLILSVFVWHGLMFFFAASHSFYMSMGILLFIGAAFSSSQVSMLTVILRTTMPEFRGRIMGLRQLAIYSFTFGSMNSGFIASNWSASLAANFNGAVGIGLTAILALLSPKLRRA
ncbi:uncharacterized protein METZ01_LOCUS372844, partial [marine metagenome]